MPDLQVAAKILSYAHYDDQIYILLNLLCTNTMLVSADHRDVLQKSLTKWRPKISTMIEFGHKGSKWDSLFPSKKQMKEMPTHKRIRLCRIRYKCVESKDMEN